MSYGLGQGSWSSTCHGCRGGGRQDNPIYDEKKKVWVPNSVPCPLCSGTGKAPLGAGQALSPGQNPRY